MTHASRKGRGRRRRRLSLSSPGAVPTHCSFQKCLRSTVCADTARCQRRIEQGLTPSPANRKYRLGGADFRVRGYPSLPGRSLNNLTWTSPRGLSKITPKGCVGSG